MVPLVYRDIHSHCLRCHYIDSLFLLFLTKHIHIYSKFLTLAQEVITWINGVCMSVCLSMIFYIYLSAINCGEVGSSFDCLYDPEFAFTRKLFSAAQRFLLAVFLGLLPILGQLCQIERSDAKWNGKELRVSLVKYAASFTDRMSGKQFIFGL